MNRFVATLLGAGLALGNAVAVVAQDPLDELYGLGVHAYFCGRLDVASQLLTQAIDAGSQDPRAYYFRGLAQSRQGGLGAGAADFQAGAELEVAARKAVNVAKALERIQGSHRVEIEKARQAARLTYRTQQLLVQRARLEAAEAASGAAPASAAGAVDPFAGGTRMLEGAPSEAPRPLQPTTPVPNTLEPTTPLPQPTTPMPTTPTPDPFGADASTNPFGNDPAPSPTPAKPDDSNPFQ